MINWIKYYEKVVGASHPTLTDVVNRPAQQMWDAFSVAHEESGLHKAGVIITDHDQLSNRGEIAHSKIDTDLALLSAHLVETHFKRWVVRGDGLGPIAFGTFNATDHEQYFSLVMGIRFSRTNQAESLYQRKAYNNAIIFDFGKNADNQLYLTLAGNTYTSPACLGDYRAHVPLEVGCCFLETEVAFFVAGWRWAAQTIPAPSFPTRTQEIHLLGATFAGAIDFLALCSNDWNGPICNQGLHPPFGKGLHQYNDPWVYYGLLEGMGDVVDHCAQAKGSLPYTLGLMEHGAWEQVLFD